MTQKMITRILDAHSIEYHVIGGRVFAVEYFTQDGIPLADLVDVTTWSRAQLYDWLGY